jgi:hypothetical protein
VSLQGKSGVLERVRQGDCYDEPDGQVRGERDDQHRNYHEQVTALADVEDHERELGTGENQQRTQHAQGKDAQQAGGMWAEQQPQTEEDRADHMGCTGIVVLKYSPAST